MTHLDSLDVVPEKLLDFLALDRRVNNDLGRQLMRGKPVKM
jgi:hypothetical protein